MFAFHSTKNQIQFLNCWQTAFAPKQLYFIYVPTAQQRRQICQHYLNLFAQHHLSKQIGLITPQKAALLPYLSVEENILLNLNRGFTKKNRSWQRWQAAHPTNFFDKSPRDLTASERFYVQLYRNLLIDKKFILVDTNLAQEKPTTVQTLLTALDRLVKTENCTLIFLTANTELLASETQNRLTHIPFFTAHQKSLNS
ncbi:hypothetical protein [Loigolactobacillus rennini]|nr:hypothetical protein [Loigolactobacillus rennini]